MSADVYHDGRHESLQLGGLSVAAKKIGLVVDASGPQATACGLNQTDIETTLSKRLAGAGLSVRANADEDTYATPVLVQVSLLHEGGLAGGPAGTHPAAVQRGLEQYLDLCTTRISDANRP